MDIQPVVIDQELFKGVLERERKRVDRSNHSLGLLVVSADGPAGSSSSSTWNGIVGALTAAKRETDLLGWFEQGRAIGVALTDIDTSATSTAHVASSRIRRKLAQELDSETLGSLTIRFHLYPEVPRTEDEPVYPVHPLPAPAGARRPGAPISDAIKRGVDIVGSLVLLMLLAPLLLLVAVLIKLKSPGPILFRQVRVGRMMKPFTMIKFRTMQVNADHSLHHEFYNNFIKAKADAQDAGATRVFKLANDPRVTPLGRVLRKTSIDELPQLWNVLRGEMSLVGPRPPLHYEVEQYQRWHRRRVLEVKPGLTGLWQVSGRSRTTFDEMVRLDLRYAKSCSLWTDVKILMATPLAVIGGKDAV